jgi:hypothetical protein
MRQRKIWSWEGFDCKILSYSIFNGSSFEEIIEKYYWNVTSIWIEPQSLSNFELVVPNGCPCLMLKLKTWSHCTWLLKEKITSMELRGTCPHVRLILIPIMDSRTLQRAGNPTFTQVDIWESESTHGSPLRTGTGLYKQRLLRQVDNHRPNSICTVPRKRHEICLQQSSYNHDITWAWEKQCSSRKYGTVPISFAHSNNHGGRYLRARVFISFT